MIEMQVAEREAVEELKRRTLPDVTPKMLEDEFLFYRFCKARDFDLAQSESMLRKTIAWRKEFEIDSMLTNYKPLDVLVKYAPTSFICFTKDGCLVRHIDCGRADMKGLLRSVGKIDFMKYLIFYAEADAERIKTHRNKLGDALLMYVPVFDFEDLTYANATNIKGLQHLLYAIKSYLDNYPERLKYAMIINAPSYFTWSYAVLKQILPSTVKQKIRFYGVDGWKQDLLELVDSDDLPAFLGGSKTDPDGNPLCKTFVMRGEPIPECYYKSQERRKLLAATDSDKVTILPFSKQEISFEVNEENSCIEFEFHVKDGDINYSVCFQDRTLEEPRQVEIVPNQRVDSYRETEKGIFKCEKIGTYTLIFDNSYSWIRSKQIHYRTRINQNAS